MDQQLLGVILGLFSAAIWGAGDFGGGLATRRISPFQTLLLTTSSGMIVVLIIALLLAESIPSLRDLAWAVGAGITGAFGMAALYHALSTSESAVVAPTAAIIGITLPILLGTLLDGFPGILKLAGFLLAASGVWFISRTSGPDQQTPRSGLVLASLAGVGFASFFVLISRVQSNSVFSVLFCSRFGALIISLIMLCIRKEHIPSPKKNWIALLAGVLDAGGNVFYMLAQQVTRMDVAVVVSSMYPASTVLLSHWILGEHTSRKQWVGIALCLCAIALLAS